MATRCIFCHVNRPTKRHRPVDMTGFSYPITLLQWAHGLLMHPFVLMERRESQAIPTDYAEKSHNPRYDEPITQLI